MIEHNECGSRVIPRDLFALMNPERASSSLLKRARSTPRLGYCELKTCILGLDPLEATVTPPYGSLSGFVSFVCWQTSVSVGQNGFSLKYRQALRYEV